jgi:hypothetical protein
MSHSGIGVRISPQPTVERRRLPSKPVPVKTWDVYADNFIDLVQGGRVHCLNTKRILFSSLAEVLHHLDDVDNVHRQEPASVKKMLKGNATLTTHTIVLGWMLDTCDITIQLPSHRIVRLFEILDSITQISAVPLSTNGRSSGGSFTPRC